MGLVLWGYVRGLYGRSVEEVCMGVCMGLVWRSVISVYGGSVVSMWMGLVWG